MQKMTGPQAEGKTTGLIKIITRKNGKIEGVSIVGSMAGEMMNIWALAIAQNLKVSDIAAYVAPYPTMSEIGKRPATNLFCTQHPQTCCTLAGAFSCKNSGRLY